MEEGTKIGAGTGQIRELTEAEALQLSISESDSGIFARLARKKGGGLANTFSNFVDVLEFDPYLKGKLSMNALNGRACISSTFWNTSMHPLRSEDRGRIREYLSRCYGMESKQTAEDAIELVAGKNKFHPVLDLLDSLPKWDGVRRIRKLFPKYLGAEESDFTEAITMLLLCGAIQRVRSPGTKFDYCIILADTKQGTGKSTICRFLALRDEWYTDGLKSMDDPEKSFEVIRGHWVIELGELIATRKTKDIESIKQFISAQTDTYREKYSRHAEDFPRQAIFIGTTNRVSFLPEDSTGNRRFIPLICDGSRAECHPLDNEPETREYIRKCYAEALAYIAEHGVILTLDRKYEQELETVREVATPEDSRVGLIQAWLDKTDEQIVCTRMIWDKVFPDAGEPKKFDLVDLAEILTLKVTGWKKYTGKDGKARNPIYRFEKYGRQRAWSREQAEENFLPVNTVGNDEIPFD